MDTRSAWRDWRGQAWSAVTRRFVFTWREQGNLWTVVSHGGEMIGFAVLTDHSVSTSDGF